MRIFRGDHQHTDELFLFRNARTLSEGERARKQEANRWEFHQAVVATFLSILFRFVFEKNLNCFFHLKAKRKTWRTEKEAEKKNQPAWWSWSCFARYSKEEEKRAYKSTTTCVLQFSFSLLFSFFSWKQRNIKEKRWSWKCKWYTFSKLAHAHKPNDHLRWSAEISMRPSLRLRSCICQCLRSQAQFISLSTHAERERTGALDRSPTAHLSIAQWRHINWVSTMENQLRNEIFLPSSSRAHDSMHTRAAVYFHKLFWWASLEKTAKRLHLIENEKGSPATALQEASRISFAA